MQNEFNHATAATSEAFGLKYWAEQVLATREHGSTYVHFGARKDRSGSKAFEQYYVTFSFESFEHEYKVYAHYSKTGKTVPTNVLKGLIDWVK